jgi:hypothetical protein
VIPQAGYITMKEVEYVGLILSNNPEAKERVFIYELRWKSIGSQLTPTEKGKSKLQEIQEELASLRNKFPENIILIDV